jgi:iron complex transport system substrate-binding protein
VNALRLGPDRRRWLVQALGAALSIEAAALAPLAVRGATPGLQVTDLAGRRVAVPARLQRLASAGGSPAVNAFLFGFGLGERIVTGLPAAFDGPAWRWQRVFGPQIAASPVVSGPPPAWTPNVEALLALQPDLSFVVSEAAAALLARAGLPAVVLQWDRPDSIERTVALLGEIFGDAARARAWAAWRDDLLQRVAARIPPGAPRPRVLYLRHATLTQPIGATANQLIAQAGGLSVTAGDNPLRLDVFPFTVEQALAWQPEVLLLASGSEAGAVAADARLAALPALRQRRIHAVPQGAHLWTHYTPEQPLGVLWLAKHLHPQALADLDLAAEARRFYRQFFGHAMSDADLRVLLPP